MRTRHGHDDALGMVMTGIVEQVRAQARASGLLPDAREGAVVAMLSGGRDSVCLLDVTVALCGATRVHALHVNYGLREQAAEEQQHCRALCDQLEVEMEVVRADRRTADAANLHGNLHAWARTIRYEAAFALTQRIDPENGETTGHTVVAAGHTATDQVETILYRLAASPGRRALLGMPARDGRLVRPLLGVTREQTAAYCTERALAWCEDASNDSPEYARARVRHGLAPALDAVHPAARANVLRTAALLGEETELLDGLVDAELAGRGDIALQRLEQLPAALQRLIVIRLAEDAAGTYVPQAGERVRELLALGRRGGRAELHIGGLAGAIVEDGRLRMVKIPPRAQAAAGPAEPAG